MDNNNNNPEVITIDGDDNVGAGEVDDNIANDEVNVNQLVENNLDNTVGDDGIGDDVVDAVVDPDEHSNEHREEINNEERENWLTNDCDDVDWSRSSNDNSSSSSSMALVNNNELLLSGNGAILGGVEEVVQRRGPNADERFDALYNIGVNVGFEGEDHMPVSLRSLTLLSSAILRGSERSFSLRQTVGDIIMQFVEGDSSEQMFLMQLRNARTSVASEVAVRS